jgi:hypothetical protein
MEDDLTDLAREGSVQRPGQRRLGTIGWVLLGVLALVGVNAVYGGIGWSTG